MNNNIIHTAVIDDGINEKFYGTGELEYNIEISPELEVMDRTCYDSCSPSHGTTCAAIIKKYSPLARLISIKILNDRARGMSEQLVKALEWCVEKGIRLVNISLGTVIFKDFPSIKKAVNYAYSKGVIIVAACNNNGICTYPASHSCVIGVKRDTENLLGEGEILFNPYPCDGIETTAFSSHSLTDYKGNTRETSPSNSFAAPLVTAIVNNILLDSPGKTLEEIKLDLFKMSVSRETVSYNPYICRNMDWVNKAVIFCLCQNEHCTCSNIPFYFDSDDVVHIRQGYVNDNLEHIKNYIKTNVSDNFEAYDTVVLLDDNASHIYSKHDIIDFINFASLQNKNIVLLGKSFRVPIDASKCKTKVWTPSLSQLFGYNSLKNNKFEIPVVLLHDRTGDSLLKLQDHLIKMFWKDGYNALGVTDSSIGAAAGFEYLPFDSEKPERFISSLKKIGQLYDPDIIILSADSSNIDNVSSLRNSILPEVDIEITMPGYLTATKQILVAPACTIGSENMQKPALFDLEDEKCAFHIYEHIIDIFKQDI